MIILQARVYGDGAANRHYFSYMRNALFLGKRLYMIKPDPKMTDDECTPDAIMDECVIHGSPRTVLDKLVALRERVGPFGTLLQIGLDWGGPNNVRCGRIAVTMAGVIPSTRPSSSRVSSVAPGGA